MQGLLCSDHAQPLHEIPDSSRERGLKVDYRSVWEFVRAEALTYKKRRWSLASVPAPMSPDDGRSG
jgi:putative transposase